MHNIINAIKPWGTVEAVLQSRGIVGMRHLFIVRFKRPIAITGTHGKGIRTDSYGSLDNTPFFMRGMHREGLAGYNIILYPTKIAFDMSVYPADMSSDESAGGFKKFQGSALLTSLTLVPDQRLWPYVNKPWTDREIENLYTPDEKDAKLLEWITASGMAFLERGISITSFLGNDPYDKDPYKGKPQPVIEISTEDIISNYKEHGWTLIYE